ncbi:hypothetical protein [Aureimonas glaciei]|uniref:Uncharacterized protein n=1 Tax=Aureimonas glaciei TaxID=1776957 RepID=A0A916Y0S5_9HYPH|nr:hypothetical protein [Aureimonas glaciei]GGD24273.1 hypothetical protein GCM10011335_29000 [Aureimonas glaciei]
MDQERDKSFWLELEAASKGLSIAGDKGQAQRLEQLFEEMASEERAGEVDRISSDA